MKKIIAIAAPLCLAFALASCGNREGSAARAARLTAPKAATAQAQVEAGFPLVLSNYGREVVIAKRPQRVLTLGPNCTELFAALGLSQLVIGRSLINHSRGPLPHLADAVNSVPTLNYGSATREAVLASGADFIYAIDWEVGGAGLSLEEAEQYGMAVYVNAAGSLEEMFAEIRDIGQIFGVEERAASFIEEQSRRIEAVAAAIEGEPPLSVLVYDSGGSGVFTCTGANFESLLISLAGGRNVFSDIHERQWTTVGYEEALARSPDVILIHDYDAPSIEEKVQEIKASALSGLDAVRNERFAFIDLESVLPGNRMAHAIEKMAAAFYPQLFAQ